MNYARRISTFLRARCGSAARSTSARRPSRRRRPTRHWYRDGTGVALAALLKRVEHGKDGEERVCPIVVATPEKSRAGISRGHLRAANVDTPAFFVETATHVMIEFRAIRDSTSRGASSPSVAPGTSTSARPSCYAKQVQDRRGRYGEHVPALPEDAEPPHGSVSTRSVYVVKNIGKTGSGRRELRNPLFHGDVSRAMSRKNGESEVRIRRSVTRSDGG
jgi:hypothetical protein